MAQSTLRQPERDAFIDDQDTWDEARPYWENDHSLEGYLEDRSQGSIDQFDWDSLRRSCADVHEEPVENENCCIYCIEQTRLTSFHTLTPGTHICVPGRLTLNVRNQLLSAYKHHAIVENVALDPTTDQQATLTLIHYLKTSNDQVNEGGDALATIRVTKTVEKKHLGKDEIYTVRYLSPRYSPEEIIRRANSKIGTEGYGFFSCNCEHFASWCVLGLGESLQVQNARDTLQTIVHNIDVIISHAGTVFSKYRYLLSPMALSIDDISSFAPPFLGIAIVWFAAIAPLILYAIYAIGKQKWLNKRAEEGMICASCFSNSKWKLWSRFAMYALTSASGLTIMHVLMFANPAPYISIPAIILINIASALLIHAVPRLREALQSPFRGSKEKIQRTSDLHCGDGITFTYWRLNNHEGVVTEVTNSVGKVRVVHYALSNLLGKREIKEEEFTFDLRRENVWRHLYQRCPTYEPREVVKRARSRLHEKRFSILDNRSCHVVQWAKVQSPPVVRHAMGEPATYVRDTPTLAKQNYVAPGTGTSAMLNSRQVIVWDELGIGDIICFNYYGLTHQAVLTEVKQDLNKMRIIHYPVPENAFSRRQITEEWLSLDLKTDDLRVIDYNPVHCFPPDQVITRARKRIGERGFNTFTNRSSHFAEECKLCVGWRLITAWEDFTAGDVVRFTYVGLTHQAILTDISRDTSKICVVHYPIPSGLVSRRVITEDWIAVDLASNGISVYDYHPGHCSPPEEVVRRARSKLGEAGFNTFTNRSSHFAHDCKRTIGWRMIRSWEEFSLGDVVCFTYYGVSHQAILSDINPERKEMRIIHYPVPGGLLSRRRVSEEWIDIDLPEDEVWVCDYSPDECYPPHEVVEQARRKLGEAGFNTFTNRSSHLAEKCKLRNN